jgi:hypothetical protein
MSDEASGARLRRLWFSSVGEISDLDLQRGSWLDPSNRNSHWSYLEFVECYPDDGQLTDAYARGWLSEDEFKILTELLKVLMAHSPPGGDDYDNAAVLDDPSWHAVVAEAQRARHDLLTAITNTDERQALLTVGIDGVWDS